jgi:acetyl esterase/lipase
VTAGETQSVADAFQAMRVVRGHAAEWSLDPRKIGFIGFSAGAMLAVDVGTGYDAATRPDFIGAIYGALRAGHTVPADAPPLFVAAASDDNLLSGKSLPIYEAWRAARRPAELHIYERGGHGFGMARQGVTSDHWIDELEWWLEEHGLAAPAKRP